MVAVQALDFLEEGLEFEVEEEGLSGFSVEVE